MKVLFDTSVLVPAFIATHSQRTICVPWLEKVQSGEIQGCIATHTLAELYAVLTRLPLKPKISAQLAQRLIQENTSTFEVIVLENSDYQCTIARMVKLNITGGGIYDGLIAQAALNAKVDRLLTLNVKHFIRQEEPIASIVQTP